MPVFMIEKFNYASCASKEASDYVRQCLVHFGEVFTAPDELAAIVQAEAWQYADEAAIHKMIDRQTAKEPRDDYMEAFAAVPWYADHVQMCHKGVWCPIAHSVHEDRNTLSLFEPLLDNGEEFVAEWQQFARDVANATVAETVIRAGMTIGQFEELAHKHVGLLGVAAKVAINQIYINDNYKNLDKRNYRGYPMPKERNVILSAMVKEHDYSLAYGYAPASFYR